MPRRADGANVVPCVPLVEDVGTELPNGPSGLDVFHDVGGHRRQLEDYLRKQPADSRDPSAHVRSPIVGCETEHAYFVTQGPKGAYHFRDVNPFGPVRQRPVVIEDSHLHPGPAIGNTPQYHMGADQDSALARRRLVFSDTDGT